MARTKKRMGKRSSGRAGARARTSSRARKRGRTRATGAAQKRVPARSRPSRKWPAIIERLNRTPKRELRIRMGSPGSAQVTRCRLLAEWSNLEATTLGSTLILRLGSKG